MTLFPLILLGVFLNAAAQLLLKAAMARVGYFDFSLANVIPVGLKLATSLPLIAGLSCYVISVVVWLLVLSRTDVSLAYPLVSIGYIVNALGAYFLLQEPLSSLRLSGIIVIIIGVCLVAKS